MNQYRLVALLAILLLVEPCCSQYNVYGKISTGYTNLYSVAVSPYFGDIIVGGNNGLIAHYDSDGFQLGTLSGHNSQVIALFWTRSNLLSVDTNGNIVLRDGFTLNVKATAGVSTGIQTVDMVDGKLAINYGSGIDEFSLPSFTLINTLAAPHGTIRDIAYSKDDTGYYLYSLESDGYRGRYAGSSRAYSFISMNGVGISIDTHPYQEKMAIVDNLGRLQEWTSNSWIETYGNGLSNSVAYSNDGAYIAASYQTYDVDIFGDQVLSMTASVWNCPINGIASNHDSIAVVSSCG